MVAVWAQHGVLTWKPHGLVHTCQQTRAVLESASLAADQSLIMRAEACFAVTTLIQHHCTQAQMAQAEAVHVARNAITQLIACALQPVEQ